MNKQSIEPHAYALHGMVRASTYLTNSLLVVNFTNCTGGAIQQQQQRPQIVDECM